MMRQIWKTLWAILQSNRPSDDVRIAKMIQLDAQREYRAQKLREVAARLSNTSEVAAQTGHVSHDGRGPK